ncbi:M16 family metallopeptidase [Humisphaera borealis]|uniref:Insulinase family protein n=1 Tax=Humisphaera borealis TaxID=2807512 RepID=A0A7M2WS35_9BACT|nr:pitrilysin family protein [Humisphaera borealis]QOV88327.1 insulinase family protein [Humisphaera borealis]
MKLTSLPAACLAILAVASLSAVSRPAGAAEVPAAKPVSFTQETLPNGLRVIYAPLTNAPVTHVRVFYHVGSRDERPDRQGFAHMFEHMMFRGSAHVGNQQHMKLVNGVGGMSNAFTSFDQTVYLQTVPSQHLDMVLYMEADRMASFKVKQDIFDTERQVVGEEWRLRQNRPYGTLYEDLLGKVFTQHSYKWTPIGNMQHLAAASTQDLQDFFNTYYLPNNAVLVVAGDFDLAKTKELVNKYYAWIPKGPEVKRLTAVEPPQTETRRVEVSYRVPLAMSAIAFHTPAYSSDDHHALDLLGSILGGGRSSRLDRLLVNSENPQAADTSASNMQLQDAGLFIVSGTVLQGKSVDAVEKGLLDSIAEVIAKGVTPEELEKVKTQARISLIRGRQTAENVASALGNEALFAGDPTRVNTALAKLEAVTPADIQAAAKKYLAVEKATILKVKPDPLAKPAALPAAAAKEAVAAAPVAREVTFPADWPKGPPINDQVVRAKFEKGTETAIDGVKVIIMPDDRLPLVNWSLTVRAGSHLDPKGKEGLADIVTDMVRRGSTGLTYDQLNEELESKGATISVSAGGDYTRLSGSSLSKDLDYAIGRSRQVLLEPTFPAAEFEKLKAQLLSSLSLQQATPGSVADDDLESAVYGTSALGRSAKPASVAAITLDDVKAWYKANITPKDAILLIAGDVTVESGKAMAKKLIDGWKADATTRDTAGLYDFPPAPQKRQIVLIDNPDARGSTIRMAIRAYDIKSDDKYAGTIAGQILTSGIDSRLNKYVRAEKGLSYGVHGVFQPGRQAGVFTAGTDGRIDKAAESIEAIFHVLDGMRSANVTDAELKEAQTRTIGLMLMGMQTIQQQAQYRVDGLLNGYPIDYYDVYPEKISAVTADKVKAVMTQYVAPDRFTIVVVAPAAQVKEALEKIGEVKVLPMPAKREGGMEQPELLQPKPEKK